MSYYNKDLDNVFRKCFASSYANFSGSEIEKRAVGLLYESVDELIDSDKFLIRKIVRDKFKIYRAYEPSYCGYLKSKKLLSLFESSLLVNDHDDFLKMKRKVFFSSRKKIYIDRAKRYAQYERIPLEFANIALTDSCIKYLVGFFLNKHVGRAFDSKILAECKAKTEIWQKNAGLRMPYERVGEFQTYLHEISDMYTKAGVQGIPKKLIRTLLSVARLHFSYTDEKYLNARDLYTVLSDQQMAAESEMKYSVLDYVLSTEESNLRGRYIKNWRVRHLKPIFWPQYLGEIEELKYIFSLDADDKYSKIKLILLDSGLLSVGELPYYFEHEYLLE